MLSLLSDFPFNREINQILLCIFFSFTDHRYSPSCAPSVLITFINMILQGHSTVPLGCSEFMFPGQSILQKVCVVLALLCVPVMLLGKPLYFLFQKKRREGRILVSKYSSRTIISVTMIMYRHVGITYGRSAERIGFFTFHRFLRNWIDELTS